MSEQEKPNRETGRADKPASQGEAGDLDRGNPEQRDEFQGRSGGGDSGGGAYPHPSREGKGDVGFMGHGGQSEMAYHGKGRLGERDTGGNENDPAADED